jgi:hypothetical protein
MTMSQSSTSRSQCVVKKLRPSFSQALGFFGGDFIRTADAMAQSEEKRGETAHAGTCHADEVDAHGVTVFFEEAKDGLVHGLNWNFFY